ncbi:MAG: NAD-dependent epimerase/dehydratase family protein [Pseudanabaenaceae cyanobacterium]
MTKRIFITGGSGCIGHYLVEQLLNQTDWQLYLLLRDPRKLKLTVPGDRVKIIQGDLLAIEQHADLVSKMHYLVSTAACWGGENTYLINVEKTHKLFSYLDPQTCERAIYFSTASILDRHSQLLKPAGEIGTDYIKSKYQGLIAIEQLPISHKLITVFPTIVLGGNGQDKPYSFISAGFKDILRYLPYIRWFKTEGSFHFIHAFDIAQIVTHLLIDPQIIQLYPHRLVLGMDQISVNQAIAELCKATNHKIWWQMEISSLLISIVRGLFRLQMSAWDEFCLAQRHFIYENVKPETFGLTSRYPTLTHLLQGG